jgi:hypothetical protein
MNKRFIDIAVICQEYTKLENNCDITNNICLDEIEISKEKFLEVFYPYGDNFGINTTIINENDFIPFISFESCYRTINKNPFCLLEEILKNIETDLNMSRDCFTTESRMELTHEFTKLKTICDLNCCSVVSSLPWNIVEDLIDNSNKNSKYVFIISIMFKTPTIGVKNNIIKFSYLINE